jgi:hypothetical protein
MENATTAQRTRSIEEGFGRRFEIVAVGNV